MELEPRSTQTCIKHEILEDYLNRWGSIISYGLLGRQRRTGRPLSPHFVYVDCFAYKGQYCGEQEDAVLGRPPQPVYGSPVIGVRALDKIAGYAESQGLHTTTAAILIEKDRQNYLDLCQTLDEVGLGKRLKETTDFEGLGDREIAVANGDALQLAEKLLAFTTQPYHWSFYLLDPRGPSGIPYPFVNSVVAQDRHDVMINFIIEDLLRKAGMLDNPNLSRQHTQLIDHWAAAFGSERWKRVVEAVTPSAPDPDDAWELGLEEEVPTSDEDLRQRKEAGLVKEYGRVLQEMDAALTVKSIRLRFPDKERPMFYLFLTTHDPTGALSMNEILANAKYREYELRSRLRIAKRTAPPQGQFTLLDVEPVIPEPDKTLSQRPDDVTIARVLHKRFAGRSLTKKEVYRQLANDEFFPKEVDKGLAFLKQKGLASYGKALHHSTVIKFKGN